MGKIKISGFSYIRNGFKYDYPFLQSIQSILPICDEFVIAVGNSEDGTRESIEKLNDSRIKIIDTVWDEQLRVNGTIFAQQANIALKACTGEWLFHIQADEVIHEDAIANIKTEIERVNEDSNIEGLLFDFLNFYGSYNYLNDTRYQHKREIRVVRNKINVYSYKDSQGFRKYPSYEAYSEGHPGNKLKVKYIHIPVYHYSYVRSAKSMNEKAKYFETFWHDDEYINKNYINKDDYDFYGNIDRVKLFTGEHPSLMNEIIMRGDFSFNPKLIYKKLTFKEKIAYWIDDLLGYRLGEYKNYILVSESSKS